MMVEEGATCEGRSSPKGVRDTGKGVGWEESRVGCGVRRGTRIGVRVAWFQAQLASDVMG